MLTALDNVIRAYLGVDVTFLVGKLPFQEDFKAEFINAKSGLNNLCKILKSLIFLTDLSS